MHILIIPSERYVSPDSPLGGIFQFHQARALVRAGLEIGVIAPEPLSLRNWKQNLSSAWAGVERDEKAEFPTYRFQGFNWLTGRVPLLYPYGYQWRWERWGRKMVELYVASHGRPDLVHVHNCLQAGIFAANCLAKQGFPFVITEHSSTYARDKVVGWQAKQVQTALKTADVRIVVTPNLGETLERQFGEAVRPWEYVPNILEDIFENSDLPARKWDGSMPFCFLHIAKLTPIKNQTLLLEAFATAFAGKPHVTLQIGGDGPLRQRLVERVRQLGIEKQVVFQGRLDRSQVLAAMQQCDAFVLSSDYETFGVVLIEAAACGRPLIATSGSGPDAIINEVNGLLVPPGNVNELAKAMQQITDTFDLYDPVAIRRDCLMRFGCDAIVGKLKGIYSRVLADAV